MSYYVRLNREPVPLGVVEQTLIAPFCCRGEDRALIIIENTSSTETLDATVWSSPNGSTQWVQEENDAFLAIAPTKSRRLVVPADRIWLRALGAFVAGPAIARVTVYQLHDENWGVQR